MWVVQGKAVRFRCDPCTPPQGPCTTAQSAQLLFSAWFFRESYLQHWSKSPDQYLARVQFVLGTRLTRAVVIWMPVLVESSRATVVLIIFNLRQTEKDEIRNIKTHGSSTRRERKIQEFKESCCLRRVQRSYRDFHAGYHNKTQSGCIQRPRSYAHASPSESHIYRIFSSYSYCICIAPPLTHTQRTKASYGWRPKKWKWYHPNANPNFNLTGQSKMTVVTGPDL